MSQKMAKVHIEIALYVARRIAGGSQLVVFCELEVSGDHVVLAGTGRFGPGPPRLFQVCRPCRPLIRGAAKLLATFTLPPLPLVGSLSL
jgi:hypothetical protein